MASPQIPASVSRTACFPCRRGKRRCDKALPACQLCLRKGAECLYPARRGQSYPSPPDSHGLAWNTVQTPEGLESNDSQSPRPEQVSSAVASFSTATAIKFLAPNIFQETQLEIPRLEIPIPPDVAAHVGDSQQIRDIASKFFTATSSWMPIICRKSFFKDALNPLSPRRREAVLLTLCMKLYCSWPSSDSGDMKTPLYKTAKRFYSEIESTGAMCISVLHSAMFIAIYEIGHAIYPSAYWTVGSCARYGIAMGLDKTLPKLMGDDETRRSWTEVEEMRRAWWGILILDRFLNFGNPLRCLTTQNPTFDDYLPVDDQAFFDFTTKPDDALSISEGFNVEMGIFARLSQSTYLICQVLDILSDKQPGAHKSSTATFAEDTAQLRRTLRALVIAAEREFEWRRIEFCCQTAVSYCGVLLLQLRYWGLIGMSSTQDAYNHMFPETRTAIDELCHMALKLRETQAVFDDEVTVFLMQIVFHATLTVITMGQGNPNEELSGMIDAFKWLLQHLRSRWQIASVYLNILEAKEATLTSATL